jgi:hypothetical protein
VAPSLGWAICAHPGDVSSMSAKSVRHTAVPAEK